MAFRSITTVITDIDGSASALQAAIALTQQEEAHLDVLCLGLDRTQPGFYYAGATAVVMQDTLQAAREEALSLENHARSKLAGVTFNWSATGISAQMIGLNALVAHRTRFSDLVILPRPYGQGRGHDTEAIVEAAMFEGDVPVIVQPDGKAFPDKIDRVVIGWNESREAMRATRAALPFLKAADTVSVAIIDPPKHGPERSDPGGQLSQFLARHGIRAEVSVLSKTMPRVADVLMRHASDVDADMLVMGAYSHSRFRESIMGGATRNMLEAAELPLFLAH
ncbi:universal stress protein [Maritimibacter sp. DP1N21-5]|uniref:universal stress protein n=1 Tax=Maritimibacter sp. DP1N21-5 TaxID=2836867 RepID=UPI001C440DA7|nr:universal stress protein [Maritimibacter sp. DP1N21-5]MBV7408508.1 universal stress protein [Maritimibacter sp. DP1N21-5]